MRIKNSVTNLVYIWGSAIILMVMNFVTRRIFLDNLSLDYLGYDGLFTSIFSFLTLSEMGIASIITYHMYSEIATNNIAQIRKLLYMYKVIYKIVGAFVLVAGIFVCPFLPMILRKSHITDSWGFIYAIYFLQLVATLCTYFLAYRRILYTCYQKIYFCTMIDTFTGIISTILKIVSLLLWKNYILYLVIAIINNVASNAIITWKSRKDYPEITKTAVSKEDFAELNLWHDVKNMLAAKIASTIYGSSDSIIITITLGSGMVGLLSNYQMIYGKIQEYVLMVFRALQASIGSLVYDKDKEKGVDFFYALDLIGFYLGFVSAMGILAVSQDFVLWWLKRSDFILPFSFLVLLCFNVFLGISNNPMTYFRNTIGYFERDRNYMIAAAVINVVMTLILAPIFGMTGVMVGTVVGHLLIYLGRTVVVYQYIIKKRPMEYIVRFVVRVVLISLTAVLIVFITSKIPGTLVGILIKGIIAVAITTLMFLLYSFRRAEFKTLQSYFKAVVDTILKKKRKSC